MKTIYSICATSAICALLSYGAFSNSITLGCVLLGMFLSIFSLSTIIAHSDIPNYSNNKAFFVWSFGNLIHSMLDARTDTYR